MCIPCWPFADVYVEEIPKKKREDAATATLYWDPNAQAWIEMEIPKKKKKEGEDRLHWDPNKGAWVKMMGGKGGKPAQQPMNYPQPHMFGNMYPTAHHVPGQPMNFPQPAQTSYAYPSYPSSMSAQPSFSMSGVPGSYPTPNYPPFIQPAMNTVGYTGPEMLQQQMAAAQVLEMNKKQEMKPADDDKMRMYWVREPDKTWTQRNRLTIDSGDIGDCRWYAMDGQFYAVRLE